jgi:hypothetical protein
MRPEYDFRGAVRGKYYKPLHKGYSVQIHKENGTTVVEHYKLIDGAVMLQPDGGGVITIDRQQSDRLVAHNEPL